MLAPGIEPLTLGLQIQRFPLNHGVLPSPRDLYTMTLVSNALQSQKSFSSLCLTLKNKHIVASSNVS